MAQLKVLGCSGGVGGALRTTALLIDSDILLDAGTGVGDLSLDELLAIDHIILSHSHLDHVAFIPFLLDAVMGIRTKPITLHATKPTLDALRAHIFNWVIWPDFNQIPSATDPFLIYHEIALGQALDFNGRKFTPLPVNHSVPAVGYQIQGDQYSLVYSGDTTSCDALWGEVNKIDNLRYIIIEAAFRNSELQLAQLSKHLCPSMLETELAKLDMRDKQALLDVYITHLKPGEEEIVMQELAESSIAFSIFELQSKHVFTL